MLASNTSTTLSNPYTPMAFLQPSLAVKVTNLTYAAVGSLAVGSISFDIELILLIIVWDTHGGRFSCGISYCISLKIINWRPNFGSISHLLFTVLQGEYVRYLLFVGGED